MENIRFGFHLLLVEGARSVFDAPGFLFLQGKRALEGALEMDPGLPLAAADDDLAD